MMKILLDTHIFLWYISGDTRIPTAMLQEIRNLHNLVYLSVVSLWEVTIKYQLNKLLNKLPLPESPDIYLPPRRRQHGIRSLNIDESAVKQLIKLPPIHRDPFDCLLICSAIEHDMTIATVDGAIQSYPVSTI